jgi:hypothetical protein
LVCVGVLRVGVGTARITCVVGTRAGTKGWHVNAGAVRASTPPQPKTMTLDRHCGASRIDASCIDRALTYDCAAGDVCPPIPLDPPRAMTRTSFVFR